MGSLIVLSILSIIGGTPDSADPAVVALEYDGFSFCSGTLIGKRTVLTAGHCVEILGPSDLYKVDFASDVTKFPKRVKALKQVRHPNFTAEGAPYDFALWQLDEDAPADPVVMASAALTQGDVGVAIRHVGFGIDNETAGTGSGIKREVTYPITRVDDLLVWSGEATAETCTYDSGGPGFITRNGREELIAVVSDGPSCHEPGWDGRVDVVREWIDQTMAEFEPKPEPEQPKGCSSMSGLFCVLAMMLLRRR
jgi:secreted trypsin-like serine protease